MWQMYIDKRISNLNFVKQSFVYLISRQVTEKGVQFDKNITKCFN